MKKWVNNGLWLFGGIVIGGLSVSEDTTAPVQASEPVAIVVADDTKTEAAKAKLEAAEAKLKKAKDRVVELEENDRIMNAKTPAKPSGLQITICQLAIQDANPRIAPIDINVSTAALVPDSSKEGLNAVWFQFKTGSDTYTAKCNVDGNTILDFKIEKAGAKTVVKELVLF